MRKREPWWRSKSTIITHGMPYPQNLETARGLEELVRARGAVPATIALIDGHMVAGVDGPSLERLARDGHTAAKASRSDLAVMLNSKRLAGTTVSTTMMIAAMAGIRIFATGGIGGVHRGAETTFDVSADLRELAQTPVAVVCAGAKAILDISKTQEVLETNGVPVIGWKTDDFPAFYTRKSGHKVDHRFDDPGKLADMLKLQFGLGMGGVLIANPVPKKYELDAAMIEVEIRAALNQLHERGISGKETTPFLLQALYELSEGKSLETNIALVRNNAAVAADLAVAFAKRS